MGVVYRGERIALGRAVAVKFLHAQYSSNADSVKRFEREAKLASRLEHPNVVSVIDFGVDSTPYIVMDFVAGMTLRELLEDGPVEPRRAVGIARQILAGLAHAHEHDVIHRDVKPPNVMLTKATAAGDHVQLLDFGLAKMRDVDQTSASVIVGTPSYMSPEQASGGTADERSDIYSTGLVLFELLTGSKLFDADEPLALLRMHIEQPPDSLTEREPDGEFSLELEAVVRTSLAKDRDERYQTAADMLAALDSTPEISGSSVPPPEESRPQHQDRAAARSFGGVIVLAIALAAVAGWWIAGKPGLAEISESLGIDSNREESATGPRSKPEVVAKPDRAPPQNGVAVAKTDAVETRIRRLHETLRESPENPLILYQLGKLYFDKGWGSEGLAAYRRALAANKKLRTDARLNGDAISALGDPKTRNQARSLIVKVIGKAAIPFLQAAASSRPKLRRELSELIRRLDA